MRLETEKSGFTGDEGIEKHLVRIYFDDIYETTFAVIHDEHTGRLWISYIPWRIEVEAIQTSTPTAKEMIEKTESTIPKISKIHHLHSPQVKTSHSSASKANQNDA